MPNMLIMAPTTMTRLKKTTNNKNNAGASRLKPVSIHAFCAYKPSFVSTHKHTDAPFNTHTHKHTQQVVSQRQRERERMIEEGTNKFTHQQDGHIDWHSRLKVRYEQN